METKLARLMCAMIEYEAGNPHRVHHFIKVHDFARTIGSMEFIPREQLYVLEVSAIVHDIGIRAALEKYGSSAGAYQEELGPPLAREMLGKIGFRKDAVERVCYLVAHHHTFDDIDDLDYQILVEADFLVNLHEEKMTPQQIKAVRSRIFKTKTATQMLDLMYQPELEQTAE